MSKINRTKDAVPTMHRRRIDSIMKRDVLTISQNGSVALALRRMRKRGAGSIVIVKEKKPLGIFTERDLLRIVSRRAPTDLSKVPIGSVMTDRPVSIESGSNFQIAFETMQARRCRHLLILDKGMLVGIVSVKDMIALRTAVLEDTVEERTRELTKTKEKLETTIADIRRELKMAGEFQKSIVSQSLPGSGKMLYCLHYRQAESLGGDFFELIPHGPNQTAVLMADVSGHGATSAMISMLLKHYYERFAVPGSQPRDVIEEINRRLTPQIPAEYFAAGFYGLLDSEKGSLVYTRFGMPRPFVRKSHGRRDLVLKAGGMPVGIDSDARYEQHQIELEPEDALILYTDGCTDQQNPSEERYGETRLHRSIKKWLKSNPLSAAEKAYEDIRDFAGGIPQTDDITLLICIQANGRGPCPRTDASR